MEFRKNCVISIMVILLYFFWPTLMGTLWQTFGGTAEASIGLTIYNVVGDAILIVLLFSIYYKTVKKEWNIFCVKKKENMMSILKYTILLFFSVLVCNIIIHSIFKIETVGNEVQLYQQFKESSFGAFFMVNIYSPLVEILVFQTTIRKVTKNPWLFIIISSLFFGYFNIAFTELTVSSMIGALAYVLLNAIVAYSYYKKDNMVVPIGIKMFYNLLVTMISFV